MPVLVSADSHGEREKSSNGSDRDTSVIQEWCDINTSSIDGIGSMVKISQVRTIEEIRLESQRFNWPTPDLEMDGKGKDNRSRGTKE